VVIGAAAEKLSYIRVLGRLARNDSLQIYAMAYFRNSFRLFSDPTDVCWGRVRRPRALTPLFIDQRLYRFDALFPRRMTAQKQQRRVRFAL
jgi:hypothetical protein